MSFVIELQFSAHLSEVPAMASENCDVDPGISY
jgi:hypothetical protein